MGLVRVWLAQSRFDEAERFLAKKLEELGNPPELYVALGLVYREAREAQEAMRAFEQALAKNADYAQAHFYLAAQLDQLDRRQEARESLRRTIQLEPNHPDALNYLGYLDAEEGVNLEEAKVLIERALELDPENGAYLDSLGWVYFKMGKLDEAIALLERAAELVETDPVIFDHLGDAYHRRREPEKARRAWEHALELDKDQDAVREKLKEFVPPTEVPVP
jgi:tetratricopeptide (TPR) repeat protein